MKHDRLLTHIQPLTGLCSLAHTTAPRLGLVYTHRVLTHTRKRQMWKLPKCLTFTRKTTEREMLGYKVSSGFDIHIRLSAVGLVSKFGAIESQQLYRKHRTVWSEKWHWGWFLSTPLCHSCRWNAHEIWSPLETHFSSHHQQCWSHLWNAFTGDKCRLVY